MNGALFTPSELMAQAVMAACGIMSIMFTLILLAAVLMFLVSAFSFMVSMGREEAIAVAKRRFLYTVVGVALAVLARSVVVVISSSLGFADPVSC